MSNKKRFYDKNKVFVGLLVFVAIMTFPFWYNRGKVVPGPTLVLSAEAKAAKTCIRSTDFMKAEHMQLLNSWRDTVVRDGKRIYVNENGKAYNMSLSNTCLECHSNKAEFCDRCHNYASVRPYCWDCHLDNPKEKK
jgi:hypothetical protein